MITNDSFNKKRALYIKTLENSSCPSCLRVKKGVGGNIPLRYSPGVSFKHEEH